MPAFSTDFTSSRSTCRLCGSAGVVAPSLAALAGDTYPARCKREFALCPCWSSDKTCGTTPEGAAVVARARCHYDGQVAPSEQYTRAGVV